MGWVGAGGNVGGACFSIFFIHFDYEQAFTFMGVAASASAILSCFMNVKSLTQNAETIGGHEAKTDDDKGAHATHHHNEGIGITKDTTITFAQLEH